MQVLPLSSTCQNITCALFLTYHRDTVHFRSASETPSPSKSRVTLYGRVKNRVSLELELILVLDLKTIIFRRNYLYHILEGRYGNYLALKKPYFLVLARAQIRNGSHQYTVKGIFVSHGCLMPCQSSNSVGSGRTFREVHEHRKRTRTSQKYANFAEVCAVGT